MNLYPIGLIAAASDAGTLDSVSYSLFEPNKKCSSQSIHDILTTKFQDQTMLARKKSFPFLTIQYEYENIFDREFRQIEHFVAEMEDALTSFFVVDFSKGLTPSGITDSTGDWVVAITNTRLFSEVANQKAHRAFVYNGSSWKEGPITAITTNTSITVDVDTSNYGALALASANSSSIVYPMYQVYFSSNVLQNFSTSVYIEEDRNLTDDGGFMRSGSMGFISKYKV